MIEVQEFISAQGRNPFAAWVASLDHSTRTRVLAVVARVRFGNLSSAKSVGAGVQELRLDFGPGYRIYFGRSGETLVLLLGGGTKSQQDADIRAAQMHWQEFKNRKGER